MTNTDKERTDFETVTDGDFLERIGLDAVKWAREFNIIAKRLEYSDMDEGWLIGWFANAIERGRMHGYRAGREAERAEKVYPDFRPEEMTFTKVGDQLHVSERTEAEPFAWWAETGTYGSGGHCNKLFFMRELAVDHVREHGGHVVTVYRGPPETEPSPDVEAENKQLRGTLEYILAQTKNDYPGVLSVIRANASAALDRGWQKTVSRAIAALAKPEGK